MCKSVRSKKVMRVASSGLLISLLLQSEAFANQYPWSDYFTCEVRPVAASNKHPQWVYVGPNGVYSRSQYAVTLFALVQPGVTTSSGFYRRADYVILDVVVGECALNPTSTLEPHFIGTGDCSQPHVNGNTMFFNIIEGPSGQYAIAGGTPESYYQYWEDFLSTDKPMGYQKANINKYTKFYMQNCYNQNGQAVTFPNQ